MKKHAAQTAIEFEPEYVTGLKKIFEEMIVFNQLLGLKVTSIEADRARGRIEMRREPIGWPRRAASAARLARSACTTLNRPTMG